ncbi:MAG TPA: ParB/RepB/Spo0J family partition protein [Candidatus Saccharimonadales bacterium]|nr:ParB/RepB/Spo0J family partition protein [Candidatus Saccharimonadales bacterium]
MSTKHGLGRGFDALIPQNFDKSILLDEAERIQKVPVDKLKPHSEQPRQHFDETALKELAQSIKNHGVLQPLVVTPLENGMYRIIAGERRWRAAQLAKLQALPVVVRTLKELEALEIALVENVQRVDLSPLEQAVSIERLHQQFSMAYDVVATRLGKATSTVNNIVRLLQLPQAAQEALAEKRITEGHARQILALKDYPDQQAELLESIQKYGWSVRQAERYVTSHKEGVQDVKAARERVQEETPATKALGKRLGTKVAIKRMAHGGRLEITFKNDDELEQIVSKLR